MENIMTILADSNAKLAANEEITFNNLNKLYNYQLKCEKNEIYYLIETFWNEYNSKLGIDIRDSLYEVGTGVVEVYFEDVSDTVTGKKAYEYVAGEDVHFKLELRQKETNILFPCSSFSYIYRIDGVVDEDNNTVDYTGTQSGESGIFTLTIPASEINKSPLLQRGKGVVIELLVEAFSTEDTIICEGGATLKGYAGGAAVNFKDIKATQEKPSDYEAFWAEQIERVKNTDPTDATVPTEKTRYSAIGEHPDILLYDDIDLTNYFHIKKFDKALLSSYREKGLSSAEDSCLDLFDIYEIYLKAPGPNPATGILTIPKNKTGLDARFGFAGYGVSAPSVSLNDSVISFHATHHGYPCGLSRDEYYTELYAKVLNSYGTAVGRPNSTYKNKDDCYILYMFLRNLQAVRFIDECKSKDIRALDTDSALYDLYANLKRAFSGSITLWGGSMGGYQTLGISALSAMAGYNVVMTHSLVSAFCNNSGYTKEGRINNIFGVYYEDNMDYFDGVFFAEYIKSEIAFSQVAFGDYTCPPSGIIAAYNAVKSKKTMNLYQNSQHDYWPTRVINGIEKHTNPVYTFKSESKI